MRRNCRRSRFARLWVRTVALLLMALLVGNMLGTAEEASDSILNAAVLEIEKYLTGGEVDLSSLLSALDGVPGKGNLLYAYVEVLWALEEENYSLAVMRADLLLGNEGFDAFLSSVGSGLLGTAADLRNYAHARQQEANGIITGAIESYRACLTFFDSRRRESNIVEAVLQDAYQRAESHIEAEEYYEAYLLLIQLEAYGYSYSAELTAWIEANAPEAASRAARSGVDPANPDSIPEAFRLFPSVNSARPNAPVPTEAPVEAIPGNILRFGLYEQDNDDANGPELIEWVVLEVDKTENRVLVISKYGLDARPFDPDSKDQYGNSLYPGWADSNLREWLNEEFYRQAFTEGEQSRIKAMKVVTHDSDQVWGKGAYVFTGKDKKSFDKNARIDGGPDTRDKLFVLSHDEAEAYFDSADKRMAAPTAYAISHGAWQSGDYSTAEGKGCCWWWLRSPGSSSEDASYVIDDGEIYSDLVTNNDGAVRPAMWVDLALFA